MKKLMRVLCAFALLSVGTLSIASSGFADTANDRTEIQKIMKGTWEKPDAPLRVDPIVIALDYAIADWAQGDMGGRALLRRKSGAWTIVLCSGDALKSAETLTKAAVPSNVAAMLAKSLAEAERALDPQVLAQFSHFEGLVMMDQAGNHPHSH
jgi:periplasmic copper chaperone A